MLSCVVAIAVNLSQFLCLGRFSATSFQVLGHAKTILVLFGGWAIFHETMNFKQFSGEIIIQPRISALVWRLAFVVYGHHICQSIVILCVNLCLRHDSGGHGYDHVRLLHEPGRGQVGASGFSSSGSGDWERNANKQLVTIEGCI